MTMMPSGWLPSSQVKQGMQTSGTPQAVLVDRPVEVRPYASDLDVGLIDKPAVAGDMAARPGCLDELRGLPLHPAVDGDVVYGDTALGQQFLHVAVGQAVPQVPAHRDRDHLSREPEASKDGGRAR